MTDTVVVADNGDVKPKHHGSLLTTGTAGVRRQTRQNVAATRLERARKDVVS